MKKNELWFLVFFFFFFFFLLLRLVVLKNEIKGRLNTNDQHQKIHGRIATTNDGKFKRSKNHQVTLFKQTAQKKPHRKVYIYETTVTMECDNDIKNQHHQMVVWVVILVCFVHPLFLVAYTWKNIMLWDKKHKIFKGTIKSLTHRKSYTLNFDVSIESNCSIVLQRLNFKCKLRFESNIESNTQLCCTISIVFCF